jgi:precorrin-2/cobalt-factor-2 C20-methyltransferase
MRKIMRGTFYVVGVGPGDPQLMTLRAVQLLNQCQVWFVPSAFENGGSMALKIVSGVVASEGKTILSHRFPMKMVRRGQEVDAEVAEAWRQAAETISACLGEGRDVVFPTLGDPSIYSTGFYVCETLLEHDASVRISIIPGVSAIGSSAASACLPLCLGDERLVVIPATFADERIREMLRLADVAVFMKVHKVMDRLVALLEAEGLVERAVLVERSSLEDEVVWRDIRQARGREIHYFSTMVVRRGQTLMPGACR